MNDSKYTIDAELLRMLRCPKEGCVLAMADESLIQELNERIEASDLRDAQDQLIRQPLQAGLVTQTGTRLYPIRGGIPTLIADEAILLS